MKRQILFSSLIAMILFGSATAQTLQDITADFAAQPQVIIYTAKEIITLDPVKPKVTAVAVLGSRILAAGSLDRLPPALDVLANPAYRIAARENCER